MGWVSDLAASQSATERDPERMAIRPKIEVLQTKMESLSLMVTSITRHLFFATSFQTSGQHQHLRVSYPLLLPHTRRRGIAKQPRRTGRIPGAFFVLGLTVLTNSSFITHHKKH